MSSQNEGALKTIVAPPASENLPGDLNALALELFKEMVASDKSLPFAWMCETLIAVKHGLPESVPGLEALAFGGQKA